MKRLLYILIVLSLATGRAESQSFTIDDLVTLSSLSSKSIDHFIKKNGFSSAGSGWNKYSSGTSYFEKIKTSKVDSLTGRSIDIYKEGDTRFFVLHTTSLSEYRDGQRQLISAGFFYDKKKDLSVSTAMLFQKKDITIETLSVVEDDIPVYTFLLQKKELPRPSDIKHAEDLLKFTSHEYLAGFFGEKNVKKDLYYFSEKELKKCSVLFSNSSLQAVFVWNDEDNLSDLAYVLVSNVIPTVSAAKFNGVLKNNLWQLKNGIYPGMSIKELLKVNEKDFEIYGNQSEMAFMVKSESSGKVDFKKTAIMLSCSNCNDDRLFNKQAVKALDLAEENLPVYVYNIIIFPPQR